MRSALVATLLLILTGTSSALDEVQVERGKVRPSTVELAKRLVEYGLRGDMKKAGVVAGSLEGFAAALDKRWKLDLKPRLDRSVKNKEPKELARLGFSLAYWDLMDHLRVLQENSEVSTVELRRRILLVNKCYRVLSGVARRKSKSKTGRRLHSAASKLLRQASADIPRGEGYGGDDQWRLRLAKHARDLRKIVETAHGRTAGFVKRRSATAAGRKEGGR